MRHAGNAIRLCRESTRHFGRSAHRAHRAHRARRNYCSAEVSFITLSTYLRYHGLRDHRSSVNSRDTAR